MMCDEIFGSKNNAATLVWQKRTSPDMRKRLSTAHEYIVVYAKKIEMIDQAINPLELSEKDKQRYKNPDNDPKGPWTSTDYSAQGYRPNQMYTIVTPGGKKYTPVEGHCWKNVEEVFLKQRDEGRFWFGVDGNGVPRRKTYLFERQGKNIWTWWPNSEVGHTQEATNEVTAIFGARTIFDYPKPVRLIQRIVQIATDKDSIILDSFAGSGTTAHAVLNANKADGGSRRFILVEMEDYADSITAERVRRVVDGYGEGNKAVEGTGGGFSYYELGERLFLDDENLNPDVPIEEIRRYIWFMETRGADVQSISDEDYLLGINNGTAYYFIYEKDSMTVLDKGFLSKIRTGADDYVIYADTCMLSDEKLMKYNITFKKIPRDITRL